MIDITNVTQSPALVFSNLLMLTLFFFSLKPALYANNNSVVRVEWWTVLWILIFCVFSFWGADWFGYLNYFVEIKRIGPEHVPMESVYLWLMDILPHYLLFRLVVWGVAIVLLSVLIRQYDVNRRIFFFFFCTISIIWFAYARATVAMMAMFCGLSLLYSDWKRPMLVKLIGLLLIGASYFLHKSSLLGVFAIVVALILDKLIKRNGYFWILFFFVTLLVFISYFFEDFFQSLVSDEDSLLNEYASSGASHLYGSSGFARGWGTRLRGIFERLPLYLIAFGCIKSISSNNRPPKSIRLVMLSFCAIVLISSIFALNSNLNTYLLFSRLLRFGQVPFCICLTYFYQNGNYPKLVRLAYSIAIFGSFYSVTYAMYDAFTR